MYILTREHNLYDQKGEYYVAIFKDIEDVNNKLQEVIEKDLYSTYSGKLHNHIINGGGRMGKEDVWFNLYEQQDSNGCEDCLDKSANRIVDESYWNFCPYCGRNLKEN